MPVRRQRPRRADALRAPQTLEDLSALLSDDPDDLAAAYGSVKAARERYDYLVETGQWHRHPDLRPPGVWWASEPGVPDDLRSREAFSQAHPELSAEAMRRYDEVPKPAAISPAPYPAWAEEFGYSLLFKEARGAWYGDDRMTETDTRTI
jgi:hypothetical protein